MSDIKSDVAELLDEMGIPFERDVHPLAVVPNGFTVTVDRNGERLDYEQMNLSDTLFPPVRRADTPMVKLSISSTIELTQEQYQAYLDGARLGPGAVVEVRAVGYVQMPGAAWVKRRQKMEDGGTEEWWGREGRIKIKLTDLGELTPTGEEFSE